METTDPDGCSEPQAPNRKIFFAGRLLGVQDLQAERTHILEKDGWHASRLHDCGVVCGLRVRPTEPPQPWCVVVEPGLAVDPCGREIVVRQAVEFQLRRSEQRGPIYLVIEQRDGEDGPTPAPGAPDGPQDILGQSRIAGTFRLEIRTEAPEGEDGLTWGLATRLASAIRVAAEPETLHNLLAELVGRSCPPRRQERAVTLARIDLPGEGPITEAAIDNYSHRPLPQSVGQALSLVVGVIRRLEG